MRVGKSANIAPVSGLTRRVSWVRAARREFKDFPRETRDAFLDALTVIADGGTPGIAKPLKGFGSGILELALRHRGDAYRVVYAVQVGADIWVVHAFQKKSKTGIKTPKAEIGLIHERLKRLKEMLG